MNITAKKKYVNLANSHIKSIPNETLIIHVITNHEKQIKQNKNNKNGKNYIKLSVRSLLKSNNVKNESSSTKPK